MEAGMTGEPSFHGLSLVSGVIVEDQVQVKLGRCLPLDQPQEADEFSGAVAEHALADYGVRLYVESSKQRRGAMPLVVVRHGGTPAKLDRKSRLGAVQCLDLALLIYREHQGVFGRVHVETDDVADLLDEVRIFRKLKGLDPIRLQPMLAPNAVYRQRRQAARLRLRAQRPVRRRGRILMQRALDHRSDLFGRDSGESTAAWGIPEQALGAVLHVARLPAPDRRLAFARSRPDRHRPCAVRSHQHDTRTPDMVLRALAVGNHLFEPLPLARPEPDLNTFPHAYRFAHPRQHGNHLQRLIH